MIMNKILTFLLSFLLFLGVASALEPGERITVDATRVNVRALPKMNAEVVCQVEFGQTLEFKSLGGTNWVEIVPPSSVSFWVHQDYLQGDTVVSSKLNVRSGAGINYSVVGRLKRHDQVIRKGNFSEWVEIAPPAESSLWISRSLVKFPEVQAQAEPVFEEEPLEEAVVATVEVRPQALQKDTKPLLKPKAAVAPPPAPEHLDLIPLPGQGRVVKREGYLRGYLLKGSAPSRFSLEDNTSGAKRTICYLDETDPRLKEFRGKNVIIQGREYWVQGEERPVLVPQAIVLRELGR